MRISFASPIRRGAIFLLLLSGTVFGIWPYTFTNDVAVPGTVHGRLRLACSIHPSLGKVRGILLAVHGAGGDYRYLAVNERMRTVAYTHAFAVVGASFLNTNNGNALPMYCWENLGTDGDQVAMSNGLADLAVQMNCPELATAPVAVYGFSQGGGWAVRYASYHPSRVIAFAHDKFGHWTNGSPDPAWIGMPVSAAARKVPGVLTYGTADGAAVRSQISNAFFTNRQAGALWALVEDYQMGHLENSYGNFFGLRYLDELIELRLPDGFNPSLSYTLNDLDETAGFVGDPDGFTASIAPVTNAKDISIFQSRRRSWFPTLSLAHTWSAVVTRAKSFVITDPPLPGTVLGSNWYVVLKTAGSLGARTISGSPDGTVSWVDWFLNGRRVASVSNSPFTLNMPNMPFGTYMIYGRINGGASITGAPIFFGRDNGDSSGDYGTNAVPGILASPAGSLITNQAFSVRLDLTNKEYGYWSTNGSPWARFDLSGVTIPIVAATTELRYFGSNMFGRFGAVTTNQYTVTTPATKADEVLSNSAALPASSVPVRTAPSLWSLSRSPMLFQMRGALPGDKARLQILTPSGILVRTLEGRAPMIAWNLLNDGGRPVPLGNYLYSLTLSGSVNASETGAFILAW